MAKAAGKKAPTKTEVFNGIAEATGLTKKDVAGVFDALSDQIRKSVGSRGPGLFTIPGLCKIVVQSLHRIEYIRTRHRNSRGSRQWCA